MIAANVMFVGIAVALDTVVKVTDSFFDMLAPNIRRRVFVATITGVTAVVVAHMAGDAARIVIAVKREILVVIESRWCPLVLLVALAAVAAHLLVQRIARRLVTGLALRACIRLQQRMIEASLQSEAFDAGMIAVTGHAILIEQFLVKRRCGKWLDDRLPAAAQATNIGRLVATDATRRRRAAERRVTGKAVGVQRLMARN